jgi:hypothetical protein
MTNLELLAGFAIHLTANFPVLAILPAPGFLVIG